MADRIHLNQADVNELAKLPDIGQQRARKIVEYRDQHGPFQALDELRYIDGLDDMPVEDLRDELTVH